MRLGQLARKLALRPGEIVEFLAKNNIHIDEGTNTRIDEVYVKLIQDRYAPELQITTPTLEHEEIKQPLASAVEVERIVEKPQEIEDTKIDLPQHPEVDEEIPEVIKAPKISLSGLKVLGKIELPEVKKKDPTPESTTELPVIFQEDKKPRDEVRTNYDRKRNREQRPRKNPIALQREKQALEEQKQRQEMLEREKEKRKQNYFKKVKMSPPTKAVKLVEEQTMQMSAEELAEPPKTLLGRLIKWLTT